MMAPLYRLCRELRDRRISAMSVTEQCLEHLDRTENELKAYRVTTPELARHAAQAADSAFACGADPGPFAGIPVSIKDLYGVEGLDSYAGSPKVVPEAWRTEGPIVRALRNGLAAPVGKTHTVEFAFGGLGVNSHWGTPVNPWDPIAHRVPGGSSCGAGVSLIQGSALVALGTDTAGSVRIPASMTGTVGLKTTYGRWPLSGIFPLSPTLDSAGILTRSVEDAAFAFAVMDPHVNATPWDFVDRLRQGRAAAPVLGEGEPALWDACEIDIAEVVTGALGRLEAAGARRISVALPEAVDAQELLSVGNVVSSELAEMLESEMPEWLETLDPIVGSRIRDGGRISASEWLARKRRLAAISRRAVSRFERCEIIASPTVAIRPPTLETVREVDGYRAANIAALNNTCVANSLTLCSISMPVGLDDGGMPVGLQLMAPGGSDEQLLSAALWIEDVIGKPADLLGGAPRV